MAERIEAKHQVDSTGFVYFLVPIEEPISPPEDFELSFYFDTTVNQEAFNSLSGKTSFFGPSYLVSLKFWRGIDESGSPFDIDVLMNIANRAFPMGSGDMQPKGESFPMPKVVIEAAVQVEDFRVSSLDSAVVDAAFDRALYCIRNFQRAYGLVSKAPVTLVTRERAPLHLPMVFRSEVAPGSEGIWSDSVELYSPNANIHSVVLEEIDEAMLEKVEIAFDHYQSGRAFIRYSDLTREALASRRQRGDYRVSIILAATAVETLFDDLLMHLLWEEKRDPQDAAATFSGWLMARVKNEYHVRLGGKWRVDKDGPIKDWNEKLANLRNRVVHSGYDPSAEEADSALDAMFSLENFLIDRVAAKRAKYPRTALMMISEPVLAKRNELSRALKIIMESKDEPDWGGTFGRWQAVLARCRQVAEGAEIEPTLKEAKTVAVIHPDGDIQWWLHDLTSGLVCPAGDPVITDKIRSSLEEIKEATLDKGESVSVVFDSLDARPIVSSGIEWKFPYKIIPGFGVMVDNSDSI